MVETRPVRALALVIPLLHLIAPDAAGGAAPASNPGVTAAAQVTTNPNPTRAHSSPQIARNPKTGELVIVETDVYGGVGVNIHLSNNNGRSWFPGGDPMMKPFTWNSDYAINGPYFTMAFDKAGGLFIAFTATDPKYSNINRAQRPRSVFLARSGDGGRTFTTSFAYQANDQNPKTINNRRGMVSIDPRDS